jgi:membrane protein implicated in regulation of membrane protease activity
MDAGLIWVLAGIALLGAELLLPGVWFLWLGLAAIGTGLALLVVAPGFAWSVALFLALLGAGILVSLRLKPRGGPAHRVNAPEAGLAGRHAVVVAVEGGGLRVRLGDSDWPARLPRGVAMPEPGSVMRVEAVDGTQLVVRPDPPPAA